MWLLVAGSGQAAAWDWQNLTIWAVVCVLSELLWLPTISGQATVSMASTFNLAVIYLLGWERSLWIVASSTLFANLAIQKKEWYKAIFNVGQSVLAAALAGMVFQWTGGTSLLPEATGSGAAQIAAFLSRFNNIQLIIPFLASGTIYHITNTFLVAGVISLSSRQKLFTAWKHNYGYKAELVSSMALLFLAPQVVLSYGAASFTGIVLFFVPLVFIRDSSLRYIELQKAQDSMVRSERMVAKGEMAAEIGHELNNYLAAMSGRAQMILMILGANADPKLRKCAEIIYENMAKMASLTAGLMGAAHNEPRKCPSRLNDLVTKTVDFVRPQNKFDGIRFQLDLDDRIPTSDMDPGQIQQVLLNLFSNAADAIEEARLAGESGTDDAASANFVRDKVIKVTTLFEPQKNSVVMTVSDNGPGMSPQVAGRIFEPTFTTKANGHGFGLSTSYRIIVMSHRGKISVDTDPGRGATFTVQLPLDAA